MDLAVVPHPRESALKVARNWARRFEAALREGLAGRHGVRWWVEEGPADEPYVQWIDVSSMPSDETGPLAGRVRLTWDPARANVLAVEPTSEGLPKVKSFLGRVLGWLAVIAAVAAFALWVWFVIHNWTRCWNRIASFFGSPREDVATKLEVGWLLVGWAVGPALVGFSLGILGDRFDDAATVRRRAQLDAFAHAELDPRLASTVEAARAAAAADPQAAADLGLA